MECESILGMIELVRPGSDDIEASEFEATRLHLQTCQSCQAEFNRIQRFDRAVFALADEIEIPTGADQKLIAQLCENSPTESDAVSELDAVTESDAVTNDETIQPVKDDETSSKPKPIRRRVFQSVCATMLLLVVAIFSLVWETPITTFAVADLEQRIAFNIGSLPQFGELEGTDALKFRVPTAFMDDTRLTVADVEKRLKGQDLDADGVHDLALIPFSYYPADRAPFGGVVAAIPASRVEQSADLPSSFSSANVRYTNRDGRSVVLVSWRDQDFVYFCLVTSPVHLELIQSRLRTATA